MCVVCSSPACVLLPVRVLCVARATAQTTCRWTHKTALSLSLSLTGLSPPPPGSERERDDSGHEGAGHRHDAHGDHNGDVELKPLAHGRTHAGAAEDQREELPAHEAEAEREPDGEHLRAAERDEIAGQRGRGGGTGEREREKAIREPLVQPGAMRCICKGG